MDDLIKHGDKLLCLFGRVGPNASEITWEEETREVEIRITKNHDNDNITVGIEDFNFIYPEDLSSYVDKQYHIFRLVNFYVKVYTGNKYFEDSLDKDDKNGYDISEEIKKKAPSVDSQGAILKDFISLLKSMDVKTVIFNDGNSMDIK